MLDHRLQIRADGFSGPAEVLASNMSLEVKRGILADWASDMRAVENQPALRRLDNGRLVLIDDILAALSRLDRRQERPRSVGQHRAPWWHRRRDDDDDPPPAPAAALPPGPQYLIDGAAAVAA